MTAGEGQGQWVRVRQRVAEANGASASQIHIARSLRRSRVRTEIAMYLYKIHPEASYPADIARNIGIEPTNILGGLRGMSNRFDESNSLLGLGLVDKIGDNGASYYLLSEHGKSVIENLNKKEVKI